MRFIYLDGNYLRKILDLKKDTVNLVYFKDFYAQDDKSLEKKAALLESEFPGFEINLYWEEYQTLLKAVEVEKFSIGIILQVIVVVALFNLVAFIIFISERKSQELFLLRALGGNFKLFRNFWLWSSSFRFIFH